MSTNFDPNQDDWKLDAVAPSLSYELDDAEWMLLNVYADGEATPEEAAQAEALLRSDARIARAYTLITTASQVAQSQPEVEPPAALRASIQAATTGRKTLSQRIRVALDRLQAAFAPAPSRLVLAGGACAGILLLALFANSGHHRLPIIRPTATYNIARNNPPIRTNPHQPETNRTPDRPHGVHSIPPRIEHSNGIVEQLALNATPGDHLQNVEHPGNFARPHHDGVKVARHKYDNNPMNIARVTQRPHHMERHEDSDYKFNILPNMDREFQTHLTPTTTVVDNTTADNSPKSDAGTAPAAVPTAPHLESAVATSTSPAPRLVHVARLTQLPTDTRRFLPTADIRRAMEARHLNLNTVALENVRHGQVSVSLINLGFN